MAFSVCEKKLSQIVKSKSSFYKDVFIGLRVSDSLLLTSLISGNWQFAKDLQTGISGKAPLDKCVVVIIKGSRSTHTLIKEVFQIHAIIPVFISHRWNEINRVMVVSCQKKTKKAKQLHTLILRNKTLIFGFDLVFQFYCHVGAGWFQRANKWRKCESEFEVLHSHSHSDLLSF